MVIFRAFIIKEMKAGITGASGHVGNNLVRELIRSGHQVRVMVHHDTRALDGLEIDRFEGDILSSDDTLRFCEGLDVVFHLAARIFIRKRKRWQYYRENIRGTENILRATEAGGCRLIHFSSIHAYDPFPLDLPLDESRPLVLNDKYLYNRSKAQTHQMVMQAFDRGLKGVVLCPTAVLGPGDYKPSLLGEAVWRMACGRLPALIPGGYDWVDVRDVAKTAVTAAESDLSGEDFLLSGRWVSLADMHEMIRREVPGVKKLPVLPSWLARAGAPFMEAWAGITGNEPLYTSGSVAFLKHSHRQINHEKATRLLEFTPRSYEETLRDTLAWFHDHNKNLQ